MRYLKLLILIDYKYTSCQTIISSDFWGNYSLILQDEVQLYDGGRMINNHVPSFLLLWR